MVQRYEVAVELMQRHGINSRGKKKFLPPPTANTINLLRAQSA